MNNIYKTWLNHINVSDDLKKQMKKMDAKTVDAAFSSKPLKFGTAGYRAIMGPGTTFLNVHTYQQLASGYAKFILKNSKSSSPTVLIAHDNRANANEFSYAIIAVLTSYGIKVKLFKDNLPMLTPIVSYCVRKLKLDGAINITASHNPKEYNGFKAYNSTGAQVTNEEANQISSLCLKWDEILNAKFIINHNMISYISESVIDRYLKKIKKSLFFNKVDKKQNIIYSCHHGAGSRYVANFLRSLGHNIIDVKEQNYFDESFTNSPFPNPEDSKSFELSLEYARKYNASIMLGVDPDADRLAVAIKHNKKWYYLNGNQTGILLSYYILYQRRNEKNIVPIIISTHVSNNLINKIAEDFNAIVIRTATGFKNIGLAMDKINNKNSYFCIGFEEAIGSCPIDFIREKDSLSSAAFVLDMINYFAIEENMDLIEVLYKRIFSKYGNWFGKTISLTIPGYDWKLRAQKIEDKLIDLKIKSINGWKVNDIFWNESGQCLEWILNNNSWIKFRISGTEPKFKIYYNLFFDKQHMNIEKNIDMQEKEVINLTKKITDILKLK